MGSPRVTTLVVGTPRLAETETGDLRAADFAWQAFQAGRSYERHGLTSKGVAFTEDARDSFVAWWNAHPQVKRPSDD